MEQKNKSKIQTLNIRQCSNIMSFIESIDSRLNIRKVSKQLRKAASIKGLAYALARENTCKLYDVGYFTKEIIEKMRKAFQKYESDPNLIEEMIVETINLRFEKTISPNKKEKETFKEEFYLNQKADYDIKIFGNFLARNDSIKKIYLNGSEIGYDRDDFVNLFNGLGKNRGVAEFYFGDNFVALNNDNAQVLADALAQNSTLKVMDLSQNNVGNFPKSLEILCKGILKNKNLEWINLGNMGIGKQADELQFLAEVIEKHPSLKILNLGRNYDLFVDEANAKAFAEGIKKAKKLEQLTLNNCSLGKRDYDFILIKEAILNNKTIKLLNLNANSIGGDFWGDGESRLTDLAEIIRESSIKKIRFSENSIEDNPENMKILMDAISGAKSILHIDCVENNLWFNQKFQNFVSEFNEKHHNELNNNI